MVINNENKVICHVKLQQRGVGAPFRSDRTVIKISSLDYAWQITSLHIWTYTVCPTTQGLSSYKLFKSCLVRYFLNKSIFWPALLTPPPAAESFVISFVSNTSATCHKVLFYSMNTRGGICSFLFYFYFVGRTSALMIMFPLFLSN